MTPITAPRAKTQPDNQRFDGRTVMLTQWTATPKLWAQRARWRAGRIPPALRLGLGAGLLVLAGLMWTQYGHTASDQPQAASAQESGTHDDDHDHAAHDTSGEGQLNDAMLPDWTPDAARAATERFAANFANPAGGHAEWLARLAPDTDSALLDQYRLTDIRNVPQATVTAVDGPIGETAGSAIFHISYSDGARSQVELYMDRRGWKIATVIPLDAPLPVEPPAPASPAADTEGGQ